MILSFARCGSLSLFHRRKATELQLSPAVCRDTLLQATAYPRIADRSCVHEMLCFPGKPRQQQQQRFSHAFAQVAYLRIVSASSDNPRRHFHSLLIRRMYESPIFNHKCIRPDPNPKTPLIVGGSWQVVSCALQHQGKFSKSSDSTSASQSCYPGTNR